MLVECCAQVCLCLFVRFWCIDVVKCSKVRKISRRWWNRMMTHNISMHFSLQFTYVKLIENKIFLFFNSWKWCLIFVLNWLICSFLDIVLVLVLPVIYVDYMNRYDIDITLYTYENCCSYLNRHKFCLFFLWNLYHNIFDA